MNQNITLNPKTTQEPTTKANKVQCKLCTMAQLEDCVCMPIQYKFVPSNPAAIIFKGLIANNPNNPGINLKEGRLSYSEIEKIPLAEVCKVKLCMRNEFMLIKTLQIYSSPNQSKPVCLGVDSEQGSQWLISLIQAKLILAYQINIGNQRSESERTTGILFKKSVLGKWKTHQATCLTMPPNKHLKLSDEYSVISSTTEVWTRFEKVEVKGMECLVIKLWGTLGKKELAIPLAQLALWLRAICSLLS